MCLEVQAQCLPCREAPAYEKNAAPVLNNTMPPAAPWQGRKAFPHLYGRKRITQARRLPNQVVRRWWDATASPDESAIIFLRRLDFNDTLLSAPRGLPNQVMRRW